MKKRFDSKLKIEELGKTDTGRLVEKVNTLREELAYFLRDGGKLRVEAVLTDSVENLRRALEVNQLKFSDKERVELIAFSLGNGFAYCSVGILNYPARKQYVMNVSSYPKKILSKLAGKMPSDLTKYIRNINGGGNKDLSLVKETEKVGYTFHVSTKILEEKSSEQIFELWTSYFGTPSDVVKVDMKKLTEKKIPVYYVKQNGKVIASLVMMPRARIAGVKVNELGIDIYDSIRRVKERGNEFKFSSLLAFSLFKHSELVNKSKFLVSAVPNIFTAYRSASEVFEPHEFFKVYKNSIILPYYYLDGFSPFNGIYSFMHVVKRVNL